MPVNQSTAPTSLSIKLITAFVLVLTLVMFVGAVNEPRLLWAGLALISIDVFCFLHAPIAYEIRNKQLTVITRINKKCFAPIIKCSSIEKDKPSFGIRLWGNGGLFAGTGIFWNKQYGLFRAYVTTGKRPYLILIETLKHKVIITPENPKQFLTYIDSLNKS